MQSFKVRFRIYDLLFYILLVLTFYHTRNMACRLMMVVFFGYTVMKIITQKSSVPIPFYYVGFGIFILYGAANIVLGNVINVAVARTMVVSLTLNLLMIFAIAQYIYMQNDIPHVLRVTELGIFTTALVVILLSLPTITQGRLGGGTEMNANMLSLLCVYGFVIALFLGKCGKITKRASWFRSAFYMVAILLTGSRKGIIMIVLAIIVVRFFTERKKILENIFLGIILIAALYLVVMKVEFLYNIIGVRIENMVTVLLGGETTEASLNDRQELVEIGMKHIRKKPWTGYGVDCFKMISGMNGYGKVEAGQRGYYAHNNYIELLFGGGIVGISLYYIPVLHFLKKLIKGVYKHPCMPYLLAILLSKLAVEYAHVAYYMRMDAYIIGVLLGCVLLSYKNKDSNELQKADAT